MCVYYVYLSFLRKKKHKGSENKYYRDRLSGVWVGDPWNIWKHRNKIVFKEGMIDAQEIFHLT